MILSFAAVLDQYDDIYKYISVTRIFGDQISQIVSLLTSGKIYVGSDGLVRDGRGSHAYGFTDGKE